jgi:hypothetical protein
VFLPFMNDGFDCRGATHPFPLGRIVCRMAWLSGGRAFVDNVIEFESRVNDVWRRHGDAVIGTHRNPFFVSP